MKTQSIKSPQYQDIYAEIVSAQVYELIKIDKEQFIDIFCFVQEALVFDGTVNSSILLSKAHQRGFSIEDSSMPQSFCAIYNRIISGDPHIFPHGIYYEPDSLANLDADYSFPDALMWGNPRQCKVGECILHSFMEEYLYNGNIPKYVETVVIPGFPQQAYNLNDDTAELDVPETFVAKDLKFHKRYYPKVYVPQYGKLVEPVWFRV